MNWKSFLLLLIAQMAFGQTNLDYRLDTLMARYTDNERPGCAIGVLHDGKVVFSKGYGLANLDFHIAFTPQTVSDIGSVAKQFTAMAMLLLERDGKVRLDADIRTYLPEVPDFGNPIHVIDLLHHTNGIREIYGTQEIAGYRPGDGILQEDALTLVTHSTELNFAPGDAYSYCNTAFMLLAEIIRRVSGMPFESYMQSNIFKPLKMDHTYIMDHRGEAFPGTATSYGKEDGMYVQIYDNSTVQGAGGMYTTLDDMMKWLANYRDPVVGDARLIAKMKVPAILNNGDTIDYALALDVGNYRGQHAFGHTGSSAGYRAHLLFFPDQDLGIMVKTNTPGIPIRDILEVVATEVGKISLDPIPVMEPESKAPFVLAKPLAAYAGNYFSPELQTNYEVRNAGDHLVLWHFRRGEFVMKPESEDVFDVGGWTVAFERDAKGNLSGMRMTGGGVDNLWFAKWE
ncbi:MAG: serine hydrolase [Saprospiraceae bacterium]|nr:serine hydrolase [Saprospiraceae bacterium]MCB9320268.1 serine hydrolase [Lewinellaceae bacterium]